MRAQNARFLGSREALPIGLRPGSSMRSAWSRCASCPRCASFPQGAEVLRPTTRARRPFSSGGEFEVSAIQRVQCSILSRSITAL